MRTFDFAPLYRSTVGFDRMLSMLDQLGGVEGSVPSYPPYNIERNGENAFRISVAVAGFADADLSIEAKENTLTIRGEKQANDEEKTGDVLYKGIAERTFEIPEAMKPRAIPIASSSKVLEVQPTKAAA
jgi:molecular chaperone IbpA